MSLAIQSTRFEPQFQEDPLSPHALNILIYKSAKKIDLLRKERAGLTKDLKITHAALGSIKFERIIDVEVRAKLNGAHQELPKELSKTHLNNWKSLIWGASLQKRSAEFAEELRAVNKQIRKEQKYHDKLVNLLVQTVGKTAYKYEYGPRVRKALAFHQFKKPEAQLLCKKMTLLLVSTYVDIHKSTDEKKSQ